MFPLNSVRSEFSIAKVQDKGITYKACFYLLLIDVMVWFPEFSVNMTKKIAKEL